MKQLRLFLILIIPLSLLSTSSISIEETIDNIDELVFNSTETQQPKIKLGETSDIVRNLSSDKVGGRGLSSEGYDNAAKFVESYLINNNIPPLFENSYKDKLKFSGYTNEYNILGRIGPFDKNRETIVLGAHLDHLGKFRKIIFNGANDNATGCTALLQVAGFLSQYEFKKNIIIAFFTAEEEGLIGSKDLVRKLKSIDIKPSYMINFEMLGIPMNEFSLRQVYLAGYEMSNLAEKMNQYTDFEFVVPFYNEYDHSIFTRSDNLPFYEGYEIPAHTLCAFTVTNDPNYHTSSDTFDNLDVEYLNRVINTSATVVANLIANDDEIILKKGHKKVYSKNSVFRKR